LAFNITQFFPSLNLLLLPLIFNKAGFDSKVSSFFFHNYLIGKKTQYFWNNFSSSFFNVDIGVGQELALSPILSALYLTFILHILENQLKFLKISILILLFVDNSLFIAQNKSLSISNSLLFYSYQITFSLLDRFGLILEYEKMEVFHFSRSYRTFKSPPLDLFSIRGPVLYPKNTWRYLGYIFNRKLSFHQHINYYSNKVISMVKCIKILGNSVYSFVSRS